MHPSPPPPLPSSTWGKGARGAAAPLRDKYRLQWRQKTAGISPDASGALTKRPFSQSAIPGLARCARTRKAERMFAMLVRPPSTFRIARKRASGERASEMTVKFGQRVPRQLNSRAFADQAGSAQGSTAFFDRTCSIEKRNHLIRRADFRVNRLRLIRNSSSSLCCRALFPPTGIHLVGARSKALPIPYPHAGGAP